MAQDIIQFSSCERFIYKTLDYSVINILSFTYRAIVIISLISRRGMSVCCVSEDSYITLEDDMPVINYHAKIAEHGSISMLK